MPPKGFIKPVGEGVRLHLNWEWEKGRIISFCISLEVKLDEEFREICRYDTSHGFFHMDQFFKSGRKEKLIIEVPSLKYAFEFAEKDLKENWETYTKRYEKR